MNHLDVWEFEQSWERGDRAWMRFINKVEKLLGRELDGDEGDGLSLDGAHDAFRAGTTPEAYIAGRV